MMYGGSVYGGIPGKCPDIPLGWDGKTALEGWTLDPKYEEKLQTNKEYEWLNSWLYTPAKQKPATCHYAIKDGEKKNRLSLIMAGKDTSNTHFEPKLEFDEKNKGYHCTYKIGSDADCQFLDGGYTHM